MAITVILSNASDIYTAADSNDYVVLGLSGNDTITTNSGNDTLNGGAGVDRMTGGAGNDIYVVDSASDVVIEGLGAGIDTVQSSASITLADNVENLTMTGTAGIGTGNGLNNIIKGNASDNNIDGGGGADSMRGGAGNDHYFLDNAGDTVTELAGEGTDWVFTSVSHSLSANVENLWLLGTDSINGNGNAGANIIQGNSGNNVLDGRLGVDTMYGGGGNDTFYVETIGDSVTENAGAGTDTVRSNLASTVLGDNVENLTLNESRLLVGGGSGPIFPLITVAAGINGTGNELDNTITGNSVDNHLYGLAGNDRISGGAGNDLLIGGTGSDRMAGGTGHDSYDVDSSGDVVVELAGEGTDTVFSSISYTLGANVERLYLQLSAANGTGNSLDNVLLGNNVANVLNGSTGADVMVGNGGNDTFYVDNPGDQVFDSDPGSDIPQGSGVDTVISSVSFTLTSPEIERLSLTGTGNLSGTGNVADNSLFGNAGNNTLLGLAGNDNLYGYAGDDVLKGGTGVDTLRGGTGMDVMFANEDSTVPDSVTDRFVFDTALNEATNVDQIAGGTFSGPEATDDQIWLENGIFTALKSTTGTTSGILGSSYFFKGAGFTGEGALDPVGVYLNTTNGQLSYNATFGTAGDSTTFAVVNNGIVGGSAALTNVDFTLI